MNITHYPATQNSPTLGFWETLLETGTTLYQTDRQTKLGTEQAKADIELARSALAASQSQAEQARLALEIKQIEQQMAAESFSEFGKKALPIAIGGGFLYWAFGRKGRGLRK